MEPTTEQDERSKSRAPSEPTSLGDRIVTTVGTCRGKPRIAGTRIKVEQIAISHERMGMSPDEIVSELPHLRLSDVHAALAYYYDHRKQIDEDIREGEEFEDKLRAGAPSILEKARQRHAQDDPVPPR